MESGVTQNTSKGDKRQKIKDKRQKTKEEYNGTLSNVKIPSLEGRGWVKYWYNGTMARKLNRNPIIPINIL
jgi:hypothetical protein